MGYALPTNTDYISCSRQCHVDRPTPSSEPGTDYGSAYGSPLYAVESGRVTYTRTTNNGPTGRYIEYVLDDGRTTRSLHLSEVWVKPGDRVSRGQQIGKTGASGNGSDWGYGAHVHQTLWPGAAWAAPTLDFEKYVGGGPVAGNQRVVGPNGANARSQPNTSGAPVDFLQPGIVGNFVGWIHGESVSGNSVWFKGTSGNWFWSGGFTDTGTHDLTDLNPPPTTGTQRTAGPNGVNGRKEPNTSGGVTQSLAPGAVGEFNGWTTGENVEGNSTWFRGALSGDWFWSGGFTSQSTDNLPFVDTNPPPTTHDRTVGENPANVRALPYTTSGVLSTETAGAVVVMNAYARAESVSGQDIWFRRDTDNNWMWSGGFTSQSVEGLPEIAAPKPPQPIDPDNPRGLPEYPPVYPRAYKGLEAPLGFLNNGEPALRDNAGGVPKDPIIDTFIVHHTATTVDQLDWFSYKNNRDVCPSYYLRTDGNVFEMIRPLQKPATTGPQWNWRSISVETLNSTGSPTWEVTDEQLEEIAQMIAWLAEFDGKELDGVPVDFKIDREHVISHQEALPGTTECPGPYLQPRMDAIVERALSIYKENHPDPEPDMVEVPRAVLRGWQDQAFALYENIGSFLD
jgi:hypothetical protein